MGLSDFTRAAFEKLGAAVVEVLPGVFQLKRENAKLQLIRFPEAANAPENATLYASGTPSFSRLVSQVADGALCKIEDHHAGAEEKGCQVGFVMD